MTRQPADWAFTARIWTEGVRRPIGRPWGKIAKAIRGHGIPTITLDTVSTPEEIACQVVLKGYWHGYIGSDEPEVANAVAMAYPRQVERIRRATKCSGQCFCGRDPARTADPSRIRPRSRRGGHPPVHAPESEHRGQAEQEGRATRPLPLDAGRGKRTPLSQASPTICDEGP